MANRKDHIENKQVRGTIRVGHEEEDTAYGMESIPHVIDYSFEDIRAMPVNEHKKIISSLPRINIQFFHCPFQMEKQIKECYDSSTSVHNNY